jgi:phage tail-like protein
VAAGFQEVSGLGIEVTIAEYRNGNELENHVRKLNLMSKASDVTLKRGVIGLTDFFQWIKDTREGSQNVKRAVTIELMDEAHTQPVMTWQLTNARPMKYTGATLNAKTGTDVAIEELVLACEKLDVQ